MSILSNNISVQPTLSDVLTKIQSGFHIKPAQITTKNMSIFIDSLELDETLKKCIKMASSLTTINGHFIRKTLFLLLKNRFDDGLSLRDISVRRVYDSHMKNEALKYTFQIDIFGGQPFQYRGVECRIPLFNIYLITAMRAPHKMRF